MALGHSTGTPPPTQTAQFPEVFRINKGNKNPIHHYYSYLFYMTNHTLLQDIQARLCKRARSVVNPWSPKEIAIGRSGEISRPQSYHLFQQLIKSGQSIKGRRTLGSLDGGNNPGSCDKARGFEQGDGKIDRGMKELELPAQRVVHTYSRYFINGVFLMIYRSKTLYMVLIV